MRVLIVEDQFYSRMVLKRLMKSYGECEEVTDGKAAMDAFRRAWTSQQPYDLILLDIMMPGVDGQQALRQIRDFEMSQGVERSQLVRIIMLTALGDEQNVKKAMYDGGADAYLVKPVHVQRLNYILTELGFDPIEQAEIKQS
ncbi:response regulator [Desulfonatronovibrio magnus]|uniref:response regulator n=1 Tax=Desulfonatronovibrio magnus TaxID=698827 RepID=UPI0005EBA24B|nr:response regulator [Desulfonatronovibrio magnus]